jgi:hypothetical protein
VNITKLKLKRYMRSSERTLNHTQYCYSATKKGYGTDMIIDNLLAEINRRLLQAGKKSISMEKLLVTISVLSAQALIRVEGKEVII